MLHKVVYYGNNVLFSFVGFATSFSIIDAIDFPAPPPLSTGPAVRPPWTTDASFAERYAPDKTTTVMTKHSQPATPTPAQNRSSILQAAQPAPSGEKTPICSQCNKVIR